MSKPLNNDIVSHTDSLQAQSSKLHKQSVALINAVVSDDIKDRLAAGLAFAQSHRVSIPSGSAVAQIKRLSCVKWWTRQLVQRNKLDLEHNQRLEGFVSKQTSPYVSRYTIAAFRQSQEESQKHMKSQYLVNQSTGERVSMWDLSQTNVSNPAVRRAELMVRIEGTEKLAKESGHCALFLTITAPSKFHASSNKHNGATVADAQKHLMDGWERSRKSFSRLGIKPYGFRVVEPHKDGCPHWHMLLWCKESERSRLLAIMKREALRVDGNEAGAQKQRFVVEEITEDKGSATGYIAKYISKNIDGEGLPEGEASAAERARAWASLNNIRQFQQIGCPSVSVWRALRKLPKNQTLNDAHVSAWRKAKKLPKQSVGLVEKMRLAATKNDYGRYLRLQGGVGVSSREQRVKAAYRVSGVNSYGELVSECFGVEYDGEVFEVERGAWVVEGFDCKSEGATVTPWSPLNNYLFKALPDQAANDTSVF